MQASSAVKLPVRAAGLLGRFWAPLVFWYALGYVVHDLVLRGSTWLSYRNMWLGFAGLSVSVLVMLASTILMFQAVRPGLTMLRDPDGDAPGPSEALDQPPKRPMIDAIAESILPFLVFYGAWGMFVEEVKAWSRTAVNQDIDKGMDVVSVLGGATDAKALVPVLIAVGSWLVRALLESIYNRRGGRILGIATAAFEANFMFFGVFTVYALIRQGFAWLTQRTFWADTEQLVLDIAAQLAGLVPGLSFEKVKQAWGWVGQYLPEMSNDFLQPLLWLTIAGAVYGFEMARDQQLFTRFSQRTGRLAELFTREWRDKWTPLVNGIRLVFRAGVVFYLWFCLLYVAVDALAGWIGIGIKYLVGPHPWSWWWPWLGPVDFVQQGVHEVLRIALLAAAFGMALERGVARSQARGKRRAFTPAVTQKDAGDKPVAPGTQQAVPAGAGAPGGAPGRSWPGSGPNSPDAPSGAGAAGPAGWPGGPGGQVRREGTPGNWPGPEQGGSSASGRWPSTS